MRLFNALFRTSVDSILSNITKNIDALRAHAQAEAARRTQKQIQADKLAAEMDAHSDEWHRADSVANKLEALIS